MLNKKEFVDMVSNKTGKTKKEVAEATEMIINGITDAYKYYDGVKFVGFGSFAVKRTKQRNGTDPNTLEPIKIKANRLPKFYPSKSLKEVLQ